MIIVSSPRFIFIFIFLPTFLVNFFDTLFRFRNRVGISFTESILSPFLKPASEAGDSLIKL